MGFGLVLQGKINLIDEATDDEEALVRVKLGPGDYVGSFARADAAEADLGARAAVPSVIAMLTHKAIRQMLMDHPHTRATRKVFADEGLMVSEHVFAGNAKVPGNLAQINEIFEGHHSVDAT